MNAYKNVINTLDALKLKGIARSLDSEVNDAEARKVSYLSFLGSLLEAETTYRTERRLKRNMAGAHFPVLKSLDDFDFGPVKGIAKSDVATLTDFRWMDKHSNLLFFGPAGVVT